MMMINPQSTVGDLVKDRPARSRVFERLNIDYCCGGRLPLQEACDRRGLDADWVLEALRADDAGGKAATDAFADADAMGLGALTDHIEQTHHAYLRAELPRLGAMVRKVAAVHGDRYPWILQIDGVFNGFMSELEAHMLKEERVLFPLIRQQETGKPAWNPGGGYGIAAPIRVMEHEHDDAGDALQRMRDLSNGFTPPDDACNTFRAMLDGLAQLERDMHQHVHKENNVLFPKALAREAECGTPGSSARA